MIGPACNACLRASVLRSEALRYAEAAFSRTVDAAALLRLDTREMHEQLTRLHPEVDQRMERQMQGLLESVDERFGTVWTVCMHSPEFPSRLTLLDDTPPVVYGIGNATLLASLEHSEAIAIVGARRASSYGREVAYTLGNEASSLGLVAVSGMALGVDGAAHRGALQGGGRTIAVLAGGPDVAYPASHRRLHEQIADIGCVVSENPPGTGAKRWAFVARNRVIAGLSALSVFVEGSESSGARHTMEFAEQIDSAVGAVPGPVTSPLSAGPNAMLSRDEAVVIRDIADVLDTLAIEFGGPPQGVASIPALEGLRADVFALVAAGDSSPREIANGLPGSGVREIVRTLGELELAGVVKREQGGGYRAIES
ncbi:MAG: DNA-processing protein DprA [Solirubrobacterales bacterium]